VPKGAAQFLGRVEEGGKAGRRGLQRQTSICPVHLTKSQNFLPARVCERSWADLLLVGAIFFFFFGNITQKNPIKNLMAGSITWKTKEEAKERPKDTKPTRTKRIES
jgi:hypothetical protein